MFDNDATPEALFTHCFTQSVLSTKALDQQESVDLGQSMFDHYLSLSSANSVFQPGALDTLAELSERGFTTGIITNGIERIQLGKINHHDLHNKVDHVTVSAQARAHKPYKPVFDLALSRASVKPQQAWQVGDHATNDVAGAIRAGMGGIFYDPTGERHLQAFDKLEERPTHVIRHLSDLLTLLP